MLWPDKHVQYYLDASKTEPDMSGDASGDASGDTQVWSLVDQLRSENEYLREESRRKDHIIVGLVERVPALEAPSEPREAPETASQDEAKEEDRSEAERRSWRRRLINP